MVEFNWPDGKVAAVSLSYDDAMTCHFELVGPVLEAMGFRGTFYAPIRPELWNHAEEWRGLVERGHELGNHTIFHPCRREPVELTDAFNLSGYSEDRFRREATVASGVLHMIDGKTERTYGNTCHHTTIGPEDNQQSLDGVIGELFVAGRGARTEKPIDMAHVNIANLGTIGADGKTVEQITGWIDEAIDIGGWAFFTFHGVGEGTKRLQKDAEEHQQILDYLAGRRERVWTAPVMEIARYVRGQLGL